MLDVPTIIILIGILVFASHFFSWLFSFTKIPDVLILMVIGLFLGPWLGVLTPDFFGQAGQLGVMIALVIILFEGGTQLRLDSLKAAWRTTTLLAFLSFLFSTVMVGAVIWLLTGLHPILSFMVGAIVGDNASALIVPLIEKLNFKAESKTVMFLESAMSDVMSIVFALALLQAYELGVFAAEKIAFNIFVTFFAAAVIGMTAAFLWSVFLNKVRHMQNSIFTTPAFVFIIFGLTEYFHLSGLVAAIAFGITLGNIPFLQRYLEEKNHFLQIFLHPSSLSPKEKLFFKEVVFVLQTFFFVYVGLSISFANVPVLLLGLFITILLFLVRILAVRWSLPKRTPAADAALIAVMVPRGLATAVLAAIPFHRGIEGGLFIQEITYSIVLWTIAFTSVMIFLLQKTFVSRIYDWFMGGFTVEAEADNKEVVPETIIK